MKKTIVSLFLISLCQLGYSQDTSKYSKIKEMLDITGSGKLGVQVVEQMMASFKTSFTTVPDNFWKDFMKQVNADSLTEMVIPIYSKYYSTEELNELIKFYKSPIGKKVVSVTPYVMQESMSIGQKWGEKIAEKVYEELKKKGYSKGL